MGTDEDHQELIKIQRECNKVRRQSEREEEKRISFQVKNNPEELFKYVRQRKTVKEGIGLLQNAHDSLNTDDKEMATILNYSFNSVLTIEETS